MRWSVGSTQLIRLDRIYRTGHHGEELLAPELGVLAHETISPGVILEDGELTITAYVSEHLRRRTCSGISLRLQRPERGYLR